MEQLKTNLLYVLNHCELPIDEAYYITKDVFRELEDTYNKFLAESRMKAEQSETENKEEDTVVDK